MKELSVKNVIIGKQFEKSDNLEKFIKIVKEKKISVHVVEAGDRINIDKYTYIDILWPSSDNKITENSLNNNSIVCKIINKDCTILFTGDIEKIAEKEILRKYGEKLKADILKIAHHGSKTSSTIEFLNKVKPKIALIGVGKNNNFGHPNYNVLDRLKSISCNVFRTDEDGEIKIKVNSKIYIKSHLFS